VAEVDGGAQEVAAKRTAAAVGNLAGAFGTAEFKKMISDGLKAD